MLLFLIEGKMYSIGFAYSGPSLSAESDETLRNLGFSADIIHALSQIIGGALLSADYLTPDEFRRMNILWVDRITPDMLNRLLAYSRAR
jgi:hypothetical protein